MSFIWVLLAVVYLFIAPISFESSAKEDSSLKSISLGFIVK